MFTRLNRKRNSISPLYIFFYISSFINLSVSSLLKIHSLDPLYYSPPPFEFVSLDSHIFSIMKGKFEN